MPAPAQNPAIRALKKARGLALRMATTHMLPDEVMFLRGPGGRRRVALTLDDGPDALTPRYLEVLARAGARATFFVIGRACVEHPGELEAIVSAGHEVASHGFTHTEFTKLTGSALRDELERTAALLPARGKGRPLVRPPRGFVSPRSLIGCFLAGYTSAMWSLDTLDWDARDADEVVERAARCGVEAGEIILMHEGRQTSLDALPRVIENLQRAGFELVTVSELMDGKPS